MYPKCELLAPAGNWDCARAAIENGADAIYFGLDTGFNARARATNFHVSDLPRLMDTLHRQLVRGYVTLNTLVFTDELSKLEENVRLLAEAGVDAVLVQDLGVARLIREVCPGLAIHASTQMTLTSAAAIEQVRELGIQRVVLARELSIEEVSQIHSATSMPLEVFVHGALCVAYSGQCLTSESLGGRSANRGQCAQACRLPYDLICDGQPKELGPVKYLLSPQDLAAIDLIPQLIAAGVVSLKIEGRLKTAEYVANVCSHYRSALDAALARQPVFLSVDQRRELELSFSRGLSPGWLEGCDHKRLVPGLSSSKRGVLIGYVNHLSGHRLSIRLEGSLSIGDGIVLEGDRLNDNEIGGRIYEVWQDGRSVNTAVSGEAEISMQRGILERVRVPPGLPVYKTDDPKLTKRLRKSFQNADPIKRAPVDIQIEIAAGSRIRMVARTPSLASSDHLFVEEGPVEDENSAKILNHDQLADSPCRPHGRSKEGAETASEHDVRIVIESDFVPEVARKHPLEHIQLLEQLGRLGGTVYQLGNLESVIEGSPMVPLSVLGKLRHEMVQKLDQARSTRPLNCRMPGVAERLLADSGKRIALTEGIHAAAATNRCRHTGQLRVLCRSLEQLEQVLSLGIDRVIADFHDLRQYRTAIDMAIAHHASIELATLRIHKPGEDGLFHAIKKHFMRIQELGRAGASSPAQGMIQDSCWLVRSLAAVHYCRQHAIPFAADFSLNVTNPLAMEQFLRWGARRVTASYDMNRDQLLELAGQQFSEHLEVVIHQHIPMFHMEHCVFCSVLSPGRNKSDCGRPCDRHDVKLRDRMGAEHVLHADIGCRNTLYNATAQSGAEAVAPLMKMGVRQFRIELLRDTQKEATERLLQLYQSLIAGRIDGAKVWAELKADNRIGVTRGTLEQPRNPLAIL